MNWKKAKLLFILNLALCGMLMFSCSKKLPVIRIGMSPWPGYEFLYLAKEKGFYDEEGIAVKLLEFTSLSDSRKAFEREQIDVVLGTIVELIIIRNNSNKFPQTFYVADFSNGADVIIGRKPIKTVKELQGKRVAIEPSSLDLLTINLALKQNGMKLSDITLVPTSQGAMEEAFNSRNIDALCTFPPTSSRILSKQESNILFNSSQIPGYIIDLMIADKQYIEKNSQVLAGLLRGYDRAMKFMKENPEEALGIISSHLKITVDELKESYNGMKVEDLNSQAGYFTNEGQLYKAAQNATEILQEMGVIHSDMNSVELINNRPVSQAMRTSQPVP